VSNIVASGYAATTVISQLHDALILAPSSEVSDVAKARIAEKLALADFALANGADEDLQLLAIASFVMKQMSS
jgi:replication factor C subunit 2/4